MAYALIAWDKPDATADELTAIESGFDAAGTIRFFDGLRLYDEDGPRWVDVMQFVYDSVKANPGLEAIVIMPAKGARVGGWTAAKPSDAALAFARGAMNMAGSSTNPVLFKCPEAADSANDWQGSVPW
jgi:hypothetical protein